MSVASKNLFALLGNDEDDSDSSPAPVKTVEKAPKGTTKRNTEPVAPTKPGADAGGRRHGSGGNGAAFRDKEAGSARNHSKDLEEPTGGGPQGGRGARERGGRGGRFPRTHDDRHTKSHGTGSEKQAALSWGAVEGEAEQRDEVAGEEIAQTELTEATAEEAGQAWPDTEPVQAWPDAEPEDKSISYSDYLAQLAEKKSALGESLAIRKPNEGTKIDKKWANAKPLTKEDDDDFIAATAAKAKREKERKTKQVLDIDQRYVEPRGGEFRGGRGGRARGGGRGGRGGYEGRGAGRSRDDYRGDFAARDGGEDAANINPSDEYAFPSLGG